MATLQILAQIPPMLYISLILLPPALYGFFAASGNKKKAPARLADPADQLREKTVDVRRESISGIFLGVTIALAAAAVLLIGGIIGDYKNSRGLFSVVLPAATFPPAPEYALPPAPQVDEQGGIVGENNIINSQKSKGGLFQY